MQQTLKEEDMVQSTVVGIDAGAPDDESRLDIREKLEVNQNRE